MNDDTALEEALKRLFDAHDKWLAADGNSLGFWKALNARYEAELKKRQAPPREPLSEWQELVTRIKERANGSCEQCGDSCVSEALGIVHKDYDNNNRLESNLKALCNECFARHWRKWHRKNKKEKQKRLVANYLATKDEVQS